MNRTIELQRLYQASFDPDMVSDNANFDTYGDGWQAWRQQQACRSEDLAELRLKLLVDGCGQEEG